MSAPSTRGQRGGSSTRGGRATPFSTNRGRGSTRGSSKSVAPARGRGRGGSATNATVSRGGGLLQQLRAGTVKRGSENGTTTFGRGELDIKSENQGDIDSQKAVVPQAQHPLLPLPEDEVVALQTILRHSTRPKPKRRRQIPVRRLLRPQISKISRVWPMPNTRWCVTILSTPC